MDRLQCWTVVRAINELYRVKGSGRCWHGGYDVHLQDVEFQYDTRLEVASLFCLIAMRLACGSDGVGGSPVS